jgi:hypothetical protein
MEFLSTTEWKCCSPLVHGPILFREHQPSNGVCQDNVSLAFPKYEASLDTFSSSVNSNPEQRVIIYGHFRGVGE